jgi:hypothetical protein
MTLEGRVHAQRLHVFPRAEEPRGATFSISFVQLRRWARREGETSALLRSDRHLVESRLDQGRSFIPDSSLAVDSRCCSG